MAGEHQPADLFTNASDGCAMVINNGKPSTSELVGISERESVRVLFTKEAEQHA